MTTYSIETIQEAVLSLLGGLPQPVVEQAIPDTFTVLRDDAGNIKPYIAIQFGDIQQGYTSNMASVKDDDYILPIYTQAVAPTPKIARQIATRVVGKLLGATFDYAGNIRKRPGGGMFPIVATNNSTEAYMFPSSFGLSIQWEEM